MRDFTLQSPRLKDLPITREDTYYGEGPGISDKYRNELGQVRSAKQLLAFVQRWRTLWILDEVHRKNVEPYQVDVLLRKRRFNARKVWRSLRKMARKYRAIGKSHHWQIAASIKIPPPFLRAFILARKYDVPEDVVLMQMYQGVEFF
jgi:hypothetical protein